MGVLDYGNRMYLTSPSTTHDPRMTKNPQINLAQTIGYVFFGPETLYYRETSGSMIHSPTTRATYFGFVTFTPKPLTREDFLLPLYLVAHYRVLLSSIAYAIAFNFTLILMVVEIPNFFIPLFHLTAEQVGINFLGLLIGYTPRTLLCIWAC
jgi:hypothetical protein